jgi:hypothetical protein
MRLASFLRQALALALCIAALPAAAQIFDPTVPIQIVYRVEATSPFTVFTDGFIAPGVNENLLTLTSGVACNTANLAPAWVTTTADRDQAVQFAQRHLEAMPLRGRQFPVYLYAIRTDASFISVPGAFHSGMVAGFDDRAGYSPDHANALEYLMYNRPFLGERMVVASQVDPRLVATATSLWLEANGALSESGSPTVNLAFVDDPLSQATSIVPDWRLPSLLPQNEILPAQGGTSGTCAMVCNQPITSSSFSATSGIDRSTLCSVSDAISPLLFDIINDD